MRQAVALAVLAGTLAVAHVASASTLWLCRPGMANDPCAPSTLHTTVLSPTGQAVGVSDPQPDPSSRVDCFYVYPTVAPGPALQAPMAVIPQATAVARFQVARYAQHCRVYAPVYRQLTLAGIDSPSSPPPASLGIRAYLDVLAAWKDYLAHDNHGRGFVLIGHSQGSAMLEELIRREVETKPSVYRRMVSALVLGGNVVVRKDGKPGGTFAKVTPCRSASQLHCVVAYSAFAVTPPADALFGRPGSPLGFPGPQGPAYRILCTNPANLAAGPGALKEIVPAAVGFDESPSSFTGRCSTAGGASFLRVSAQGGATLPVPSSTPAWGLHALDPTLAQGNLVDLVGAQIRSYESTAGGAGS